MESGNDGARGRFIWEYEWFADASCLGLVYSLLPGDENPFFLEGRGHSYRRAREYCRGCPVVIDCLIEGLNEDNVGFQGAMSTNERNEVRKALSNGVQFEVVVEKIWKHHRNRSGLVPPISIWDDWE